MKHPSQREIKHSSSQKDCSSLALPVSGTTRYVLSTVAFKKVYGAWSGKNKPMKAGIFAQALRELRAANVNLTNFWGISDATVATVYAWLEAYEIDVISFKDKNRSDFKRDFGTKEEPAKEPVNFSEIHDKIVLKVIAEYVKFAGPMGDTRTIARMAKEVADEYVKLEQADAKAKTEA